LNPTTAGFIIYLCTSNVFLKDCTNNVIVVVNPTDVMCVPDMDLLLLMDHTRILLFVMYVGSSPFHGTERNGSS
jgi:hypothetical protein